MKPKIVILSAFLTPFRSGAEACAEEMPLQLCDQFDFTIITARLRKDLPTEDMLQRKIPVKRVGFGFWFDKWLYPFLAPIEAKKYNPHIVHAILETFAGEALMRCKKILPNAKCILTLQTTNRTFRKKKILQSPDVVTAISKHLAEIAANMGRKDVTVIPNGIDNEAIRSACAKHAKVPGRILFVGRLEKMKGVDLLLEAFAEFQKEQAERVTLSVVEGSTRSAPSVSRFDNAQHDTDGAHLHIVGDGSQRRALQNLVQSLGIADRVIFKGYIPPVDVYREYAEADVFCALSRSEAQGNVFLEAQAGGCVILATTVGGISEFNPPKEQEGGFAWLVVPDAKKEFVAYALKDCLKNQSLRAHHRSASIAHATQYNWKLIANRYAEIYKSITLSGL